MAMVAAMVMTTVLEADECANACLVINTLNVIIIIVIIIIILHRPTSWVGHGSKIHFLRPW